MNIRHDTDKSERHSVTKLHKEKESSKPSRSRIETEPTSGRKRSIVCTLHPQTAPPPRPSTYRYLRLHLSSFISTYRLSPLPTTLRHTNKPYQHTNRKVSNTVQAQFRLRSVRRVFHHELSEPGNGHACAMQAYHQALHRRGTEMQAPSLVASVVHRASRPASAGGRCTLCRRKHGRSVIARNAHSSKL